MAAKIIGTCEKCGKAKIEDRSGLITCLGGCRQKELKFKNRHVNDPKRGFFASIGEYDRYLQLEMLQKAGKISDLQKQINFEVAPGLICSHSTGTFNVLSKKYRLDATYTENNQKVAEDFKGKETQLYALKRALFILKYPEWLFRQVNSDGSIYTYKKRG